MRLFFLILLLLLTACSSTPATTKIGSQEGDATTVRNADPEQLYRETFTGHYWRIRLHLALTDELMRVQNRADPEWHQTLSTIHEDMKAIRSEAQAMHVPGRYAESHSVYLEALDSLVTMSASVERYGRDYNRYALERIGPSMREGSASLEYVYEAVSYHP
jgi:hypothetical protein